MVSDKQFNLDVICDRKSLLCAYRVLTVASRHYKKRAMDRTINADRRKAFNDAANRVQCIANQLNPVGLKHAKKTFEF